MLIYDSYLFNIDSFLYA